jgi:diphthamide synthase subunit DPH2
MATTFILQNHNKDVFLFHLHLMQTLEEAKEQQSYTYFHFVLLRQLLENISSFIGSGRVGFILSEIGVQKPNDTLDMINSLSHQNVYRFQFNEMSPQQEAICSRVSLTKYITRYNFKY